MVRRILAVLVILLVLALLVPRAYQALFGSGNETNSGVQKTADVGSSGKDGSHEEGASNGETAGVTDEVAEQEDASDNSSYSGEVGVSDGAVRTSRGLETSEDEYGVADVHEEVAVGDFDQTVPTPVSDAGGQQSIQPMLPAEPIVPVELQASAEPIVFEDAIIPQDPAHYDYSVYYYEDPTYYDYSVYYYEDPAYYDYSVYYYEEQILEESDTLDTYYNAAVVTASAQAGGGATAYAAAGGGAGTYAAISTG